MGKGRDIGRRLARSVQDGSAGTFSHQSLMGRMLDDLGGETSLQGPLRDLAMRPLFLKSLQQERVALRQSAAVSLSRELEDTYAPKILGELLDLLEAALGVTLPRQEAPRVETGPVAAPSKPATGAKVTQAPRRMPLAARVVTTAVALGPGLALAASIALVIAWLGGELERLWLDRLTAAPVLVAVLLGVQALSAGPLKRWQREAPLKLEQAGDPHQLHRWISSPWIHHRHGESLLNGLMLLVILGTSPLPLGQLLLRYCLTSLATTALGVSFAYRRLTTGLWDGATGAVAALIALAAGLSLLQWRPMSFFLGPLELPAWVLFLIYGTLQLGWVLPRLDEKDLSNPPQRLLRSAWWWGTMLGLGWALLTQIGAWLGPLLTPGS
ncbi:MAG: rhomboid family intramembrane serine protease [Cyanobacteriota bacterium]|nr:rhomboid family intramembrane serine protease [Cyanobacteriota bacterium]